jgi:predicted transcriptional regulator
MSDTRTTIVIPQALHDRVKRLAERDRRSVHQELLWLIEQAARDQEESS